LSQANAAGQAEAANDAKITPFSLFAGAVSTVVNAFYNIISTLESGGTVIPLNVATSGARSFAVGQATKLARIIREV
jgi:hypothetical protein